MAGRKDAPAIVVDEFGDDAAAVADPEVQLESVSADPSEHVVAMPSLLADGTPEHPHATVLVDDEDPRGVHFGEGASSE